MTTIYAYTQNNQAYVGKTKNPVSRKWDHRQRFGNWEYKILDEVFDNDWKPYECAWIELYKSWGYELINKNKGGGKQAFRTKEELHNARLERRKTEKYVAKTQEWYNNNKEHRNEYQRLYNENNRETIRENDKRNYLKYREIHLAKRKAYYHLKKNK